MEGVHIIERAFQVAPECGSVEQVRQRLLSEGYFDVHAYLAGRRTKKQLHDHLNPELKKPWPTGRKPRIAPSVDR